jgi:uncharacterized membrane protein YeaQ/YmgE (transglycosylase-associated protein family)
MNIIAWIFLGVIAAAVAKLLFPGREHLGGWLLSLALGIAGAFAGGWIGVRVWGTDGLTGFNLESFGVALAGAILVLIVFQLVRRARRGNRRDPGTRVRPAA